MVRGLSFLATFGFGGVFLGISPNLRDLVAGAFNSGLSDLDKYSPWSYVGCAVAALVFLTVLVNTGSRPK